MLRRENTEGLESERPLPCMGVTAPIRAHNSYYGPCPNGQKSPCYSVLILHFFQKALPRPNAKTTRGRGTMGFRLPLSAPLFARTPARCRFLLRASVKNIPPTSPGDRCGLYARPTL